MNFLEEVQAKLEAGKTDETLTMVRKALEKSPDDIDAKRAAAHVYYAKMVSDFTDGNSDAAIKWYSDYYALELPEEDPLHEQFKEYQRKIHPEFPRMQEANKLSKSGKNLEALANFDNFRDEDYEPFETNQQQKIPSLCERAYLSYSRVLLNSMRSKDTQTVVKAKAYSQEFLPLLESVLERLPRNVWLPYARTLLMSQLGKTQRVQMELIHILKFQNNAFWAWASLAESLMMEGKDQDALSCFCKAFLLPAQGELAAHVRESFVSLLVKMNYLSEAKFEINQIILTRKKKKVKLSPLVQEYRDSDWFLHARMPQHNKILYGRNAGRADQMLYADLPEQVAIVTHVDPERAVFFYAVDKKIGGKANLKGAMMKVKVGDILALKLKEEIKEGVKIMKVVGSRYEKEKVPKDICQIIQETIQIPYGRDFGFMKPSNIYVGPDLVKRHRLYDGQQLRALSLLSYNKAKAEWGWKVISIVGED